MFLREFKFFLSCALAAVALAAFSGGVLAGDPKNHFRKEIKLPELKERQLVTISPDTDFFHNCGLNLGDVRIVDEKGRPQPVSDRMVTTSITKKIQVIIPLKDLQMKVLPDGTAEARFRMPPEAKGENVVGITIHSERENFEVHAKLFGLGLFGNRTLLGEGDLVDYRGFLPLSKEDFPAKFGNFSQYLILWDRPTFTEEAKLIGLARDWGVPVRERFHQDRSPLIDLSVFLGAEMESAWPATQFATTSPRSIKVTQDPATAMTIVDIEASGEPVVSITPIFAEKDYFRPCVVYADRSLGTGEPKWEEVRKIDLMKIHYKSLSNESLEINLADNIAKKFRLTIDNSHLPPLDLRKVELKMPAREFVFFAEPGQKLWVEYGDKTWTAQVGQVGEIQYLLHKGATPAIATLGPEEAWESRGPVSYMLMQPLLWGGVGLSLVIVFAILLWINHRQSRPLKNSV